MCRHLGYLGPPRTLGSLIFEGEYSLEHQSYAPRMTQGNLLNADGFGAGWYHRDRPVRFRRARPIWADPSFREIADVMETTCAVAAIRSATVGFPVDESCAQPFRTGAGSDGAQGDDPGPGRLFSHNGKVEGFAGIEGKLRELAGDLARIPDARAPVDSALLFALAARLWREGGTLGGALAEVVRTVTALAPGRYNLLAADGAALAATTWGDCLFVRQRPRTGRGERRFEEVWISSEPLDEDPDWRPVPDRSLVTADLMSGVRITPL
ncbi:gamma-glutamyl-hercynylcysteine sulfoxide hydrolase [Actinomadura sp. NBRC 104412]|uniref:ergothioneine biosynthesis protein EgtC n=1 Tax=Actinomadura sp. NBRC 104412 TaxID=3032203 RepID=UPI0024A56588|nr:ergothioneine biosynthesis protein EgtC [Actinomadura sp. NBRC 104412]GLZ05378.1 gamma-glutamyl-hercynylcysteine sulfoxide hydrolase [Actinomadura sp. NBRC 104412]